MATHYVNSSDSFATISSVIAGAASGDTVFLNAGTYHCYSTDKIVCKTGINIQGAGTSTIIWGHTGSNDDNGYIQGAGVSNVTISNIDFKSDATSDPDTRGRGDQNRKCIHFKTGSNITCHDLSTSTHQFMDIFYASNINGVYMYNCNLPYIGHAGFYGYKCNNGRIHDNVVGEYTNAALRLDGSTNIEMDHNTLFHGAGGQAAIEFQNSVGGTNIHHNVIYDFDSLPIIQSLGASGSVSYHDNVWWNSGAVQLGSGEGNINANSLSHDPEYWKTYGAGYGAGGYTESGGEGGGETNQFYITSLTPNEVEAGVFDIKIDGKGFTTNSEVKVYLGNTYVGSPIINSYNDTTINTTMEIHEADLYYVKVYDNSLSLETNQASLTVTSPTVVQVPCRFVYYSRNGNIINKYW